MVRMVRSLADRTFQLRQTRALEAENAEAYATVQLRIELDQEQRASEALLARALG